MNITKTKIRTLAFCFFLALIPADAAFAKEWRGIKPLQSTRLEVRDILGAPTKSSTDADYFNLKDEITVVWYQIASCAKQTAKFGSGWIVSEGTVTSIGVIPKENYRREKFLADNSFWTTVGGGFTYYFISSAGVSVESYDGIVTSLTFAPTTKEYQENFGTSLEGSEIVVRDF